MILVINTTAVPAWKIDKLEWYNNSVRLTVDGKDSTVSGATREMFDEALEQYVAFGKPSDPQPEPALTATPVRKKQRSKRATKKSARQTKKKTNGKKKVDNSEEEE